MKNLITRLLSITLGAAGIYTGYLIDTLMVYGIQAYLADEASRTSALIAWVIILMITIMPITLFSLGLSQLPYMTDYGNSEE